MKRIAVIMAGGKGTRLWPISTCCKPKQFMKTTDGKSLISKTLERLNGLILNEDIYVITGMDQKTLMLENLKGLVPCENILYEPCGRNTAACITYAALYLKRIYGNCVLCFTPADSYIGNNDNYRAALNSAITSAEKINGIIVIGIEPTYPATGYGYIRTGLPSLNSEDCVSHVVSFTEKPDRKTAEEYLSSGEYLWNSGMLVSRMDVLLENIHLALPDHFENLSGALEHADSPEYFSRLESAYNSLESISFDYGVLEKCQDLMVVKSSFDWSDIGSLDTIGRLLNMDIKGNSVLGNHIGIDTGNSIIYSTSGLVATIGLEDMAVINSDNIVLVCPKVRAQEVKRLVEILKTEGYEDFI